MRRNGRDAASAGYAEPVNIWRLGVMLNARVRDQLAAAACLEGSFFVRSGTVSASRPVDPAANEFQVVSGAGPPPNQAQL